MLSSYYPDLQQYQIILIADIVSIQKEHDAFSVYVNAKVGRISDNVKNHTRHSTDLQLLHMIHIHLHIQ